MIKPGGIYDAHQPKFVVLHNPYGFETQDTPSFRHSRAGRIIASSAEAIHVATSMEAAKAWAESPDAEILDADEYPYWAWEGRCLVMGNSAEDSSTYVEIQEVS